MAKLKTGSQAKLPTLGGSVSAGALTRAGAAGKTARPARAAAAKSSAGAAAPMWMRKAAMVGKAMNGGAKMSRNTGMRGDNAPEEELPAETEAFVDEIPAPPPLPSEPVEPAKTEPFAAAPAEPVPAPPPLPTEPVEPTKTEPIPIPVAAAEPAKTTKAEQSAAKATTAPLRKPKAGDASPLLQAVPVEHEDSSGLSMFTLVVIVLLGFYLGLLMHHWQKVGEFSFFPGMPHLPG